MRQWRFGLALCVLAVSVLTAQTGLRLKVPPRRGLPPATEAPRGREWLKSWHPARAHVLATIEAGSGLEAISALEEQDIRLVQYVPDRGFVLSVARDADLNALRGWRMERIAPMSKLSPALPEEAPSEEAAEALVEFHPDVEAETLRAVAAAGGLAVVERPGLLGNHLLVRGEPEALRRLAEWDEVAYIFPASDEVRSGEPLAACSGALTELGTVGQYVATVGDGWDGPGKGSAQLGYYFQKLATRLPEADVRAEIQRALAEWARVAAVSFTPAASAGSARTVNVLFGSGYHGDPYPFDGPGGVLAHTFYPSPPNPESIAGDMHFDDDEEWVTGADTTARSVDAYSVALHELGHALGLGHSDVPGSVMYPYYRRATTLTQTDITAILGLYAAASASGNPPAAMPLALAIQSPSAFPVTTQASSLAFAGEVTGGTGDVSVTWASDRTGAGVAAGGRNWVVPSLPLQVGANTITITALDGASARATRTVSVTRQAAASPPAISIASPTSASTYSTSAASVTVSGSASSSSGITRVQWTNSRGGSGTAAGTLQWSAGSISLQPGENSLTFTATDAAGATASKTLNVTRTASTDTVAPTLKITSPSSASVLTSAAAITISGTATDSGGVASVAWSTSSGASGTASGTSYWTIANLPLLTGSNVVIVRAYDTAGNSSWRSVTVVRR